MSEQMSPECMNEEWRPAEYSVQYHVVKAFNNDVWPFVVSLMTITAIMEII